MKQYEDRTFLAHVRPTDTQQWQEHDLEEHLRHVGELAAQFAEPFNSQDWAYVAGIWHDLGKYRAAFQRYIRSASGYDAHIEDSENNQGSLKVDHSTAGAIYAEHQLGRLKGRVLAYLIAGHHSWLGRLGGR
jgi:CRISPR-associated endonuclease/helicase Cas3